MIVYQTDLDGFYIGPTAADPDPMDKGNWLIPGGCVEQEPPAPEDGERARWDGEKWVVVAPEPEPEPEPKLPAHDDYQRLIEAHVESVARERDYSSGVALASYSNSTVESWAAEAQAFVLWRDLVWQHTHAELDKIQSRKREQPTAEAFVADLPVINWPT